MLTACTVERAAGEFGAGVCADHDDNDDDGVIDCRDPDCQAEAVCGRAAPLREPDDDPAPAKADATPPPPMYPPDATLPVPPPRDTPDAQVEPPPPDPDAPPDAGPLEPVKECVPACEDGLTCIMGYCVPDVAVFAEVWKVVSVSVAMPRGDTARNCLDPNTCVPPSPPSSVFPDCWCAPDPLVRVLVKRPDEEPVVELETDFERQQDSHEWMFEDAQLLLRPEYEIVLQALDSDGLGANLVFECSVPADPDLLAAGTLSCGKTFKSTNVFSTRTFDATIAVEVRPGVQMPPTP